MATIQPRQRKDGTVGYRVVWRDAELRALKSRTFDDKQLAERLKAFLDANDNTLRLADEAVVKLHERGVTVAAIVAGHIRLLRKPQPGTIAKYRRNYRNHIEQSALGPGAPRWTV